MAHKLSLDPDLKREPTLFVGGSDRPIDPDDQSLLLETRRDEPRIVVASGPRKGEEITLHDEKTTIGRDDNAEVTIDEPSASRRHALIVNRRGRFFLLDLGTTNGTYFNGLLHGDERRLSDGDRFQIGQTAFVFRGPVDLAQIEEG